MSGYDDQQEAREQQILRFALRIIDGLDAAAAVAGHKELIEHITPAQVIALVDDLVRQEIPMEKLKTGISKLLNLFHRSLSSQIPSLVPGNSMVNTLRLNNRMAEAALDTLKPLISRFSQGGSEDELKSDIRQQLLVLMRFTDHYTALEHIVFPLLERRWTDFRCLKVMWSLHDDIRHHIKELLAQLSRGEPELREFNRIIGQIFFAVSSLIFREEKILLPHMLATLNEEDWQEMLRQSGDIEWPFETPAVGDLTDGSPDFPTDSQRPLNLGSGSPTEEQLRLMLNHLPLDLTLVDENDRVVYFSEGTGRIFPRSRAIIGRTVQNCHPPESLSTVNEIIRSFRLGEQDQADFWIDMPRGKVLIRYFALRDREGRYRGVLELSQEISDIQNLEGERRLLHWTQ